MNLWLFLASLSFCLSFVHGNNFDWTFQNVSYFTERCHRMVRRAFRYWNVKGFQFQPTVGVDVDIEVRWSKRAGKVLGIAVPSTHETHALVILFRHSCRSSLVYFTLVHEIGHLLGLDHNSDNRSIMFKEDNDLVPPNLTEKDRRSLHLLYGCYKEADAIAVIGFYEFYAFKDDRYRLMIPSDPLNATEARLWISNISRVDAYYEDENQLNILVSGNRSWVQHPNGTIVRVTDVGIPGRVEAGCRFRGDTFLFSNSQVYINQAPYPIRTVFPNAPRDHPLRGAFTKYDSYLLIVDHLYFVWMYNQHFNLVRRYNLRDIYPRLVCPLEKKSLKMIQLYE